MKNLKRIVYCLLFTAYCLPASAQSPKKINYQAVARDASGNPLAIATVTVSFTIHETSPIGPIDYSEQHITTTNQFGLFNLVIGGGTIMSGNFSLIPWATQPCFFEVIVNSNNMGTTQFLSVPYALHAKTADSITSLPPVVPWTKSADSLYTTFLNDNVGIGTASPKEKLHIVKPVGGMNPHVLLESMGGSFDIGYKIKTASGGNNWLLGKETGEFDVFKIKWSNNFGNSFTGFSMISMGRVGIGIANPLEFFQVTPDKNGLLDSSFAVTSAGKVGIGTVVPASKLDVVYTTTVTADAGKFTLNTSALGVKSAVYADAIGTGGGNIFGVYGRSENQALATSNTAVKGLATGSATATVRYGGDFSANGPGTNFGISAAATGAATSNIGGYFNASGGTTNYAAIFDQGNVGVRTVAPKNTLSVNGSIAVKKMSVSASYTMTPTDCIVECSAAATITLPGTGTVDEGAIVMVRSRTASAVTVVAPAPDNIHSFGAACCAASMGVAANSIHRYYRSGTTWVEW